MAFVKPFPQSPRKTAHIFITQVFEQVVQISTPVAGSIGAVDNNFIILVQFLLRIFNELGI